MTTKTRLDLILEALDQLGILVPGQPPSSNVMNKMDGVVDPAMDELSALGIYYVDDAGEIGPSGGNIDSSIFLSVASYLANAAAPKFNLASDTKLKALSQEAEQKLRTIARPAPTREQLPIDHGIPTARRFGWPGYWR